MFTCAQIRKRQWFESEYFIWIIISLFFHLFFLLSTYIYFYNDNDDNYLFESIVIGGIILIGLIPEFIFLFLHIRDKHIYNRCRKNGKIIEGKITGVFMGVVRSIEVSYIWKGRKRHCVNYMSDYKIDPKMMLLFMRENPRIYIIEDTNSKNKYILYHEYLDKMKSETNYNSLKKRKDGSYLLQKFPDYKNEINNPIIIEGTFRRKLSNCSGNNYRSIALRYYIVDAVVTYFHPTTGEQIFFKDTAFITHEMYLNYIHSQYDFPVKIIVNKDDLSEYRMCLDEILEKTLCY